MSACVDRGPCTNERPWTVLLGGPDRGEEQSGLIFSAANPCGAEVDPTFVQTPLAIVANWSGMLGDVPFVRCTAREAHHSDGWCAPDDGGSCLWCRRPFVEPGARALITGHVQSLASARGPGLIGPATIEPCAANVASSQPRVKLKVTHCGSPGPVIIDSDSNVVVPAGFTTIQVLAPASWIEMGRVDLEQQTPWVDVTLRITGCPCSCCYCPAGELTEWLQFADTTALADRVLVRPRRARRLAAHAVTAGGVLAVVNVQALQDPAGAFVMGASSFLAGTPTLEVIGAAPWWAPVSPAGTIVATLRWGIV